jgi:hypothetical protein
MFFETVPTLPNALYGFDERIRFNSRADLTCSEMLASFGAEYQTNDGPPLRVLLRSAVSSLNA